MRKCKRGGIGGGWKMQEKVKKKILLFETHVTEKVVAGSN